MRSEIKRVALEYFKINDIFVKNRKREIVESKWYFYYFLRNEMNLTIKSIGELFEVHHATILHGLNNFKYIVDNRSYECFKSVAEKYISINKEIAEIKKQIKELKNRLREYEKRDNF